ncbi:MAG: DUF6600 domain-containing protein, partial [Steroidobacterales bacterium]
MLISLRRWFPGCRVHAFRHGCIVFLGSLGLVTLSSTAVVAQQQPGDQRYDQPSADDLDPPTRAARLSYVEGAVSVQPAGVDDWTVATINRPLTSGDQLWSDRGSRAEIDLGSATVSLAEDSSVSLLNLGDQALQLQLNAGTTNITLRDLDASASFEIDAPNASVSLVRPGSYRIAVDLAGNTTVAMRDGQAQVVTSAGQSVILRGGQAAQCGSSGEVEVAIAGPPDAFDRWCAQRSQRRAQDQTASQYVSSDVVGAQDLDDNGEWRQEPDYGYVWYPTAVAVDWAPYRYGRWLWVTPWGWTWVDSAPWGYAPFHYGRWAYLRQRWCWLPAPPRSRAVYAPALVAWMGGAGGADSLTGGAAAGVGWLPLAPGEVYLPGYRVSPRYLHNVNASNTTFVNSSYVTNVYQNPGLQNRYANSTAPHALSVVSQSSFASGQSIAGRFIAPPAQWQGVSATPRPPAIVPARQSVLGPAAQTRVRRPPIAIAHRPVVARHEPPPPPVSIDRQMDAMRANGGRALPPAQLQQLRGPDNPRPNIVLAPQTVRSAPLTPDAAAAAAAPVTAPARMPPNDRRMIPERSPQVQAPMQSQPPVQFHPPPPAPVPPPLPVREVAPPPAEPLPQ